MNVTAAKVLVSVSVKRMELENEEEVEGVEDVEDVEEVYRETGGAEKKISRGDMFRGRRKTTGSLERLFAK